MKLSCLVFATGLTCSAVLVGQGRGAVTPFQQLESLAGGRGGRGGGVAVGNPRSEPGRPFSATATTTVEQVLADGTRVRQTNAVQQYRDAEGRVRTEAMDGKAKSVMVRDPVAGVAYHLDPNTETAVSLPSVGIAVGPLAGSGARGRGGAAPVGSSVVVPRGLDANQTVEDLGTMTVNGIAARGTRTTNVVPVGAIGNDREFRSVVERWFSEDLNLLVKSVSTDPRFGTTTYELTNISRTPPDSSLFRVPATYRMAEPAGGFGRRKQ